MLNLSADGRLVMTSEDVAKHLGVKVNTLRAYVARGQFPKPAGVMMGRQMWYADDVEDWQPPGRGARTDLWKKAAQEGASAQEAAPEGADAKKAAPATPKKTPRTRAKAATSSSDAKTSATKAASPAKKTPPTRKRPTRARKAKS